MRQFAIERWRKVAETPALDCGGGGLNKWLERLLMGVFAADPFAKSLAAHGLNFGNTSNVNGKFFDQNRLYLAMGYRLSTKADLEVGYMNQYINGKGTSFTNNHIVQLATYLRL
ncbi:MAG: DUF2490 domain-containing protein [Xanthomonadales bacterium]|nr:DUF2490 domain-containing protein [Xanthomonadales bacterium]